MASSTESESHTETVDLSLPDSDLWVQLPRRFRTAYGAAGGHWPDDAILAYMFEDASELAADMSSFVPLSMTVAGQSKFSRPDSRELCPARSGETSVVAHSTQLGRRSHWPRSSRPRIPVRLPVCKTHCPGLSSTRGLVKCKAWPTRAARKLADSKLGLSRATIEKAKLHRSRAHLVEIFVEANTPLAWQAQLASSPKAAMAASLGSMHASTIRKRMREWRKLRVFSLGLSACPWPKHIGVVLDYLQNRVAETCGRSVPNAILEALSFMERKGGVAADQRLADLPILKINFVNQATHDLEIGAPPTKKAPLLPLMLVGALELLVTENLCRCLPGG